MRRARRAARRGTPAGRSDGRLRGPCRRSCGSPDGQRGWHGAARCGAHAGRYRVGAELGIEAPSEPVPRGVSHLALRASEVGHSGGGTLAALEK